MLATLAHFTGQPPIQEKGNDSSQRALGEFLLRFALCPLLGAKHRLKRRADLKS